MVSEENILPPVKSMTRSRLTHLILLMMVIRKEESHGKKAQFFKQMPPVKPRKAFVPRNPVDRRPIPSLPKTGQQDMIKLGMDLMYRAIHPKRVRRK